MKVILGGVACLAFVALAGVAVRAADGVVIVSRVTTNGTADTSQVQLTKDKMRVDMSAGAAGKQIVIFDATRQAVDLIMPDRQMYVEMTKAQMDQMASQMQGMMAQAQAAMANMPPEQRAQMEAMMRGRGMGGTTGAPSAKIEYRKTGTDRVGQWACDKYEGTRDGQKVAELCTVAPAALGITPADTAVMTQLAEMMRGMTQGVAQATGILDFGTIDKQGFAGIPVRSTMTVGTTQVISELQSVSRQNIPDTQFAIPAGLRKQDMGGMMGGMGGRGRQ